MANITKVYKQPFDTARFIGKRYTNADRINGDFGAKWCEWFENGWFDVIKKPNDFEDGDAQIGLMTDKNGEFEYWIGVFTPEDSEVPEGFAHIDFPKNELGVCWVYGSEAEIFCQEGPCAEKMQKEGFDIKGEWCFERYTSRFCTPDEKGNVIIDICFFLN